MNFKQLFLLSTAAVVPAGALAADPQVDLRTSAGTIRIELYPAKAPKTVANFLQYAKDGHFNGTIFHRVIDGFMIQGGGMGPGMKEKPMRKPVANEAGNGLKNKRYTVAMARTSDPHSATAQFFINVADNDFLDHKGPSPQGWGYAVFGKVVSGLDVVMKIAKSPTGPGATGNDVPREQIVIEQASIVAAK